MRFNSNKRSRTSYPQMIEWDLVDISFFLIRGLNVKNVKVEKSKILTLKMTFHVRKILTSKMSKQWKDNKVKNNESDQRQIFFFHIRTYKKRVDVNNAGLSAGGCSVLATARKPSLILSFSTVVIAGWLEQRLMSFLMFVFHGHGKNIIHFDHFRR